MRVIEFIHRHKVIDDHHHCHFFIAAVFTVVVVVVVVVVVEVTDAHTATWVCTTERSA